MITKKVRGFLCIGNKMGIQKVKIRFEKTTDEFESISFSDDRSVLIAIDVKDVEKLIEEGRKEIANGTH